MYRDEADDLRLPDSDHEEIMTLAALQCVADYCLLSVSPT